MGNSYAISSSQRSYQKNIPSKSTLRIVWLLLAGSFVILACRPDSQKSKCIAFGGEDQKLAMASKPGKDVTVEVKTSGAKRNTASRSKSRGRNRNVKITVNSQPRNNRRRRNRPNNRGRKRVEAVVKQQLDKAGVTGPKAAITQSATATLGTIGPNSSGAVELELSTFMNPCLVKESTASNTFGPIQASAAQYNLWKVVRAEVRLTPLVGQNAVSGTAYRISLNTAGTPSSTGWSGLGARKHKDVRIGATASFRVLSRDMAGPREGWFVTNTNESAGESVGPTLELHSLGETQSTYQNGPFTGPIFLVELRCTWQFANYSSNPALATLEKGEDKDAQLSFHGEAGQPLEMEVHTNSGFARALETRSTLPYTDGARASSNTSDTIWQICSTAVDAATVVVPPPFGWLIKGGWWFVKKLAGRTRAGNIRVRCYASYEDAQNNRPAICSAGAGRTTPQTHTVKFVQMNTPSTGTAPESTVDIYAQPTPPTPEGDYYATLGLSTVITGGVDGKALPYYFENTHVFLEAVLGTTVDRVNFVTRIAGPVLFWNDNTILSQPNPVEGWYFRSTISHVQTPVGEIWGMSQQSVQLTNKNVITNYLVKMTKTVDDSRFKFTPYTLAPQTDQSKLITLQKTTPELTNQQLRLGAGTWYVFTAIHSSQNSYFGANGDPPLVRASANSGALINLGSASSPTMRNIFTAHFSRTIKREEVTPGSARGCDAANPELCSLPTPLEQDFFVSDVDFSDDDEDDSLLEDDDFFPVTDDQVFSSRQTLYNTMVNEGWPEDQAERLVKRALPTRLEKELRDEFLVGLADGFSPRQAAANAREKCSRGHAE
nr:MAG: capsid protein [Canine astrovirus]